ncbi:tRNA lysidine(34) synthetase TilS [Niabella drilacis]|uniref:tRNA(Ile)-lysidine synthase n=1 Tax=Niabella drilacis (strain DSM 25811 / CCM 8410 / CCUG 62505 / LMG 26954 / E90) TaxID=1285928 RepID=A0A1G6WGR0_NIADE|nr:tRNA lysidine(34) synthetase TilS [Niabella drilacis]SDD64427.1 tRNA(Ile)-lysidine synthase [Niabella drilacis]
MDLLTRFLKYIYQGHLFTAKDRLLLAVSGGVDSVVLGQLCKEASFDFGVAHCNFQLRGAASDRDEEFVKALAENWAVPFYSIRFNTSEFATVNRLSIQEAARELRYQWFEEIRKKEGFDYILTAHHANDNIETLLMNFFRGTGINGLTGIKEKNGALVRPLLFAKRTALEQFLQDQSLSFVQDASNLKDDYTRNFIRNRLLPEIASVYPEAEQNLVHNVQRFREINALYQQSVMQYRKKLVTQKGNELFIPVLLLLKTVAPLTVLFEIIKDYGFSAGQLPEVFALTGSDSGRFTASATHRVIRDRKHLIIAPLAPSERSRILIEQPGTYFFDEGTLHFRLKENTGSIPATAATVWLDARQVQFPIQLRPWRTGDYFYPLGMVKKKKVARFLIDQKLTATGKEKVWVLEMQQKILWVIGHRIDHRFRVTDTTREVVEISYLKQNEQ